MGHTYCRSAQDIITAVTEKGYSGVTLTFDDGSDISLEISTLSKFLATNPPLEALYISNGTIYFPDATAILKALHKNTFLHTLDIHTGNMIFNDHAEKIATVEKYRDGVKADPVLGPIYKANPTQTPVVTDIMDVDLIVTLGALSLGETSTIDLQTRLTPILHEILPISPAKEVITTMLQHNTTLRSVNNSQTSNPFYAPPNNEYLKQNALLHDAITDYAKTILAPMLVLSVAEGSSSVKDVDDFKIDDYIPALVNYAHQQLLHGLSRDEVLQFSEHWHKPHQQQRALRDRNYGNLTWPSLFGETTEISVPSTATGEEGWKLVVLRSPAELKKEGKALSHCVGGYSGKCITGHTHVVSVVNPQGESVSTVEFIADYQKEKLSVAQHYGKNNSAPSPIAKSALEWCTQSIENRTLPIDYGSLASQRQRRLTSETSVTRKAMLSLGFDPQDTETYKTLTGRYRRMIPDGMENLRTNYDSLFTRKTITITNGHYSKRFAIGLPTPSKTKTSPSAPIELTLHTMQSALDTITGEPGKLSISAETIENSPKVNLVICSQDNSPLPENMCKIFKDATFSPDGSTMRVDKIAPYQAQHLLEGKARKMQGLSHRKAIVYQR